MYRGYKIVANTAAGRRRYMQYLVPLVLACDEIDRYDIWINTHNGADIEFFKRLAEEFPKVNLVWQPDGLVDGIRSINAFYRQCVDDDSIYFKLDDDLLWIEPGGLKRMIDFRIDNPDYFLVTPLVINNALSTYLLEVCDRIKLDGYYNSDAAHPVLWRSGDFAAQLHRWFIDGYLSTGEWERLHVGAHPVSMIRFSINAILWFGRDLRAIGGEVPGDDEEFLSVLHPARTGRTSCWNGDVVASHFAFYPQRASLDALGILDEYGEILHRQYEADPAIRDIDAKVRRILVSVDAAEPELMKRPSPYRSVPKLKNREKWKRSFMKRYNKLKKAFGGTRRPCHIIR